MLEDALSPRTQDAKSVSSGIPENIGEALPVPIITSKVPEHIGEALSNLVPIIPSTVPENVGEALSNLVPVIPWWAIQEQFHANVLEQTRQYWCERHESALKEYRAAVLPKLLRYIVDNPPVPGSVFADVAHTYGLPLAGQEEKQTPLLSDEIQ
jgi:hypothetical protein